MNVKDVSNRTIKSLGRQMLKGKFFQSLVFVICCEIMARSVGFLITALAPSIDILSILSDVYYLVIQGPVYFARAIFFLWMFRGQPVGFNSLSHGFEYFKKDLVLFVTIFARCIIFSLLFVIPGIICVVRCSQSFYILADDPTKTPAQCINESRAMMKGLEWKYVSLILSYIGWLFLASIPQVTVSYTMADIPSVITDYQEYLSMINKVARSPLMVLCEVFVLMVNVYILIGTACFFDIASGKLVFKTDTCEDSEQ